MKYITNLGHIHQHKSSWNRIYILAELLSNIPFPWPLMRKHNTSYQLKLSRLLVCNMIRKSAMRSGRCTLSTKMSWKIRLKARREKTKSSLRYGDVFFFSLFPNIKNHQNFNCSFCHTHMTLMSENLNTKDTFKRHFRSAVVFTILFARLYFITFSLLIIF